MLRKKIAILCLAFIMMIPLLTGCMDNGGTAKFEGEIDMSQFSETNGLELPIVDEPVKLTAIMSSSVEGIDNKLVLQVLKEITGVELEVIIVPPANYSQKLQMLVSSKQLPDIFPDALTNEVRLSLVENNAIVCFDDYADMLPNFKKLFVDDADNRAQIRNTMVNGKLYRAVSYDIARNINHGFMYRKDIFDKHNIPMWTNSEEFYSALKTLKELYPDSTPLVSKRGVGLVNDFAIGWGLSTDFTLDESTNQYYYSYTQPEFKEVLDYMRKLYVEGLLDPEFLTCTEANWSAKMSQDSMGFVTFDWIDRMDLFYEQLKETNPGYDLRFAAPVGPNGGKYNRIPKAASGVSLAVSNNENKEVAMKLIDFLLSPAGAKLMTLGLEGTTYQVTDGKVEYLGMEDVIPSINTLEEKYGLFTNSLSLRYDPNCIYYQYSPKLQEAQDLVVNNNWLTDSVSLKIDITEDSDTYSKIYSNLKPLYETMVSKYILSAEDPTGIWNEWVAKANELGVDQMVAIYNNAYHNMK